MCQINFTSMQFAFDHVYSEVHQMIVKGVKSSRPQQHLDRLPEIPEDKLNNDLTCSICNVTSGSVADFQIHLQGIKHQSAIKRRAILSNEIINASKEPESCESYANAGTSSSGCLTCPSIGSVVYDSKLDKHQTEDG